MLTVELAVDQHIKICERLDRSMSNLCQAMADLRVQMTQVQADLRHEIALVQADLRNVFDLFWKTEFRKITKCFPAGDVQAPREERLSQTCFKMTASPG